MNNSLSKFIEAASAIKNPVVLELGTFRSIPDRSTTHKDFVPHHSKWIGADITPGDDVDFVGDVHVMALSFLRKYKPVDVIISCSTFEHFKYPHIAAHELGKCLKVGGLIFIQTHHCFPLHAYPYDYFRFSQEALRGCFDEINGWQIIDSCYEFPSVIKSEEMGEHPDFLNVCLYARKFSATPRKIRYKLDTKI